MFRVFILLGLLLMTGCSQTDPNALVIYSARNSHLIKPLFDKFSADTGIKIEFITDKAGVLLQRLKIEGERTPADVLITVDAGNLWHAKKLGLFQPFTSAKLSKNVPDNLRDPENYWVGISVRARTIVYHKDRVDPADLNSYESLAQSKWANKLVLRTGKKVYNQSLVGMLIHDLGPFKAERVVKGWVTNLAVPVMSSDTEVIKAIIDGKADVGIVNTYYLGRYLKKHPNAPVALFWANQKSTGVHVNVSGVGITKYAKHPEKAKQFVEWLTQPSQQAIFAQLNLEYPVNPTIPTDTTVQSWGEFKRSQSNVALAGEYQVEAIRLMEAVGYQ